MIFTLFSMGRGAERPPLLWFFPISIKNLVATYTYILDFSQLFVADAPMKIFFITSQVTFVSGR